MISVDYFNLAKDIMIALEEFNPSYCLLHEDEDVLEVAEFLEKNFDPELLAELSATQEGLFIIAGMITASYGYQLDLMAEEESKIRSYEEAFAETEQEKTSKPKQRIH